MFQCCSGVCSPPLSGAGVLQGCQFQPRAHPALPEKGVTDHPALLAILVELATQLDARHLIVSV